jgi:hypothetical protein
VGPSFYFSNQNCVHLHLDHVAFRLMPANAFVIALGTLSLEYKLLSSSLRNFLQPPVKCCSLRQDIVRTMPPGILDRQFPFRHERQTRHRIIYFLFLALFTDAPVNRWQWMMNEMTMKSELEGVRKRVAVSTVKIFPGRRRDQRSSEQRALAL